ncbi:MAG: GNAT family N-acetyltransferase [Motilibacteraceae bacterium]
MTDRPGTPDASSLQIFQLGSADEARLSNLWQLYRHDLSAFRDAWPDADGRFKEHEMRSFLGGTPDRVGYLVGGPGVCAGFALVSGVREGPRRMDAFFVVRRVRRLGVSRRLALDVLQRHPGEWRIGFQEENPTAARFWRRIAAEVGADRWHEEAVPVPGKPWIPDDRVLHLTV